MKHEFCCINFSEIPKWKYCLSKGFIICIKSKILGTCTSQRRNNTCVEILFGNLQAKIQRWRSIISGGHHHLFLNPLKTNGNCIYQLLWQTVILHGFSMIRDLNGNFFYGISQLIILMVKCGVLFQVRTVFLYTIYTSSVFKGLIYVTVCFQLTSTNRRMIINCWF
jgi:hypothetical protein